MHFDAGAFDPHAFDLHNLREFLRAELVLLQLPDDEIDTGAADDAVVLPHTSYVGKGVVPVEVDEAEVFGDTDAVVLQGIVELGLIGDDDIGLLLADG